MHLAKKITMICACMLSCISQNALAQLPQSIEADRPTQRWLPAPQGDGIDLSAQAQLLQQLRDLMSSESRAGDSALPKLSEQQLREMEKALDTMREQFGEDNLPNLESIPKEWIDQALSDPILRKQAQQLLEQYARDRKLPLPPDRTPRNSEGVPIPGRHPGDKSVQDPKPTANSNSNSKSNSSPKPNSSNGAAAGKAANSPLSNDPASGESARNGPRGQARNDQPLTGDKSDDGVEARPLAINNLRSDKSPDDEQLGPSPAPQKPLPADSERIEALQELFKKLKSIEGQRRPDKNVPKKNSGISNSQSSSQANPNSNSNHRTVKPNAAGGQPTPAVPRNSHSSRPSSTLPEQVSPSQADDASSTGAPSSDPSMDPPLLPPEAANTDSSISNPESSQSKSNKPDQQKKPSSRAGTQGPLSGQAKDSQLQAPGLRSSGTQGTKSPGAGQNDTGANSSNRTQNANANNSAPTGTNRSGTPDMDIKTELERHGLGRALQSIVEKTMKEQGDSNSANNQPTKKANALAKSKDNRAANKATPPTASNIPPSNKPAASKPSARDSDGLSKTNTASAAPSVPNTSNQNFGTSSTMSGLRDLASQFWGAIRSTPNENGSGSAVSAPDVTRDLANYGFAWNGRLWVLLGLMLIGIAMLILLARKRIVLAAAAKVAEAQLAKEILTEGIRTRADVVRAFHRFVLRRAQPVANWWNHRYVVTKLSEASPQLQSVLFDLASVYEHARYLPPDATLSAEEIDRVQAALKQCAACSV